MQCSACKWYKAFGTESSDQCLHEQSQDKIGGIRSEFVVTHRTCQVMLACRCEDHKLFEPMPTFHDDKQDERTHMHVSTGPGDLDIAGRPLKGGM